MAKIIFSNSDGNEIASTEVEDDIFDERGYSKGPVNAVATTSGTITHITVEYKGKRYEGRSDPIWQAPSVDGGYHIDLYELELLKPEKPNA